MRVYVAGPMRGYPYYNFRAFDAIRVILRAGGHEVVSPADMDRENGFDAIQECYASSEACAGIPAGFDLKAALRRDLSAMFDCDAYAMLPGWRTSTGALIEKALADALGKTRIDPVTGGRVDHDFERAEHIPVETVLEEAVRLTSTERQRQYGHPREHFARTAAGLNARFMTGDDPLFQRPIEPQEWPLMIAIDKLCGRGQSTTEVKRDTLTDVCGYMRTLEMCQ